MLNDRPKLKAFLRQHPELIHGAPAIFSGRSLIHQAVRLGYVETVQFLLTRYPELLGVDFHSQTPVEAAILRGHTQMVEVVVEIYPKIISKAEKNLVYLALRYHQLEIARFLISRFTILKWWNFVDLPGGRSILHYAVMRKDPELILKISRIQPNLLYQPDKKWITPVDQIKLISSSTLESLFSSQPLRDWIYFDPTLTSKLLSYLE